MNNLYFFQIFATEKFEYIPRVQQQPADTTIGIEQGAKYDVGINDNLHW